MRRRRARHTCADSYSDWIGAQGDKREDCSTSAGRELGGARQLASRPTCSAPGAAARGGGTGVPRRGDGGDLAAGIGRPMKYPCARSHPISRSRVRRARLSAPSATTFRSRLCARSMVDWTIVASRFRSMSWRTNDLSILSSRTGKTAQIRERGISGSEIVDGQAKAHVGDPLDDPERLVRIDHDGAFRDFQRHQVSVHSPFGQSSASIPGRARIVQASSGDVDRHVNVQSVGAPFRELLERRAQRQLGQRAHEAGPLRLRDEFVRRDRAERRVIPAGEGLGAANAPGLQVELRLVLEIQAFALDGAPQLSRQGQMADAVVVLFAVVQRDGGWDRSWLRTWPRRRTAAALPSPRA